MSNPAASIPVRLEYASTHHFTPRLDGTETREEKKDRGKGQRISRNTEDLVFRRRQKAYNPWTMLKRRCLVCNCVGFFPLSDYFLFLFATLKSLSALYPLIRPTCAVPTLSLRHYRNAERRISQYLSHCLLQTWTSRRK